MFGKLGLIIIGILGAINIPFYEEMARRIHWWQYSACRMISFTPWYIILGEFGIAFVLALLARTLRRGSWHVAVVAGLIGGISIFACYAAAFLITDHLIR
jgi:fluoride ion exporter CrcB/FEX